MLDSTPGSPTPALTRSHTSPIPKSPSGSGSRNSSNGKNTVAAGGSGATSGRASPNKSYGALGSTTKGVPFPSMSMSLSMSPTRARAEIGTTTISALGFNAERPMTMDREDVREHEPNEGQGEEGELEEDGASAIPHDRDASSSRARRELSVIEERANEALSPTKTVRSSGSIPIPTSSHIDPAPLSVSAAPADISSPGPGGAPTSGLASSSDPATDIHTADLGDDSEAAQPLSAVRSHTDNAEVEGQQGDQTQGPGDIALPPSRQGSSFALST